MSASRYIIVSLPLTAFEGSDAEDPTAFLRKITGSDDGLRPCQIPAFKIGTLDALVQQADDLAKLDSTCQAVAAKISDSLRSTVDGDEDRLSQYKMVNDSVY